VASSTAGRTWGRRRGLITELEHHSNIVHGRCSARTASNAEGRSDHAAREVDLERFEAMLSPRTRIVAVSHIRTPWGRSIPSRRWSSLRTAGDPGARGRRPGAGHAEVDVRALIAILCALGP